jgi:hypothetical protein
MESKEAATDPTKRNLTESEELLRRSKELLETLQRQIESTRHLIEHGDKKVNSA